MARVNVLLSTHNGEEFLAEQLSSIQAQSYRDFILHIRDDGSTDATPLILRRFQEENANVQLVVGDRIGIVPSFMRLVLSANAGADYFAFCDQDDVWLPTKLEDAVDTLDGQDRSIPLLYCSSVRYADRNLIMRGLSPTPKKVGFANALVENVAVGCTVVFNRKTRQLIASDPPHAALMHDWWCYLLVSGLGKVVFSPVPGVIYRQHGRNAVGRSRNSYYVAKPLQKIFGRRPRHMTYTDQAADFARRYRSALSRRDGETLARFLSANRTFGSRIAFALKPAVYRQSAVNNLKLRALLLMGKC